IPLPRSLEAGESIVEIGRENAGARGTGCLRCRALLNFGAMKRGITNGGREFRSLRKNGGHAAERVVGISGANVSGVATTEDETGIPVPLPMDGIPADSVEA